MTRSRWWLDGLVVLWLCALYDVVNNLASISHKMAIAHGMGVLRLERAVHLDPEHALNLWLSRHSTLGAVLSDYYDNAHFVVTLGLLGWIWWKRADIYRPLRNSLVVVNLIGLIVFWCYPVAPPRMLQGFSDVVARTGAFGSWHSGALASAANQFAAMPSLHIAWAVWCSLVLWRLSGARWVRALAILYPCLTGFAVLSTGNHYVLDVVAGLLTIGLAVMLVSLVSRVRLRFPVSRVSAEQAVPRERHLSADLPADPRIADELTAQF